MEETTRVCTKCGRELPIENFKRTKGGNRVSVCTECANESLRETIRKRNELIAAATKQENVNTLSSFTPRQLMEELARRGYEGKLKYTMEIDIQNF